MTIQPDRYEPLGREVVGAPRLYRIVKGASAADSDFTSNFAKGLPPRQREVAHPEMHRAVSMWDSPDRARTMAKRFPALGTFIAELSFPERSLRPSIVIRETPEGRGHYEVSGEPALLRSFTTRVFAIRE